MGPVRPPDTDDPPPLTPLHIDEQQDPPSDPSEPPEPPEFPVIRPPRIGSDEELERFRREWQNEVQAKRDGVTVGPVRWKAEPSVAQLPQSQRLVRDTTSPKAARASLPVDLDDGPSRSTANSKALANSSVLVRKPREHNKEEAVTLYARAVELEQSGQLNDALMLYRRAFKLDDSVDRLYARSLAKVARTEEEARPSSKDIVSFENHDEPYSFQRHIQLQPDYEKQPPPSTSIRPSQLTAILHRLPVPPDQTAFLPLDETLPIPLANLPPELLDPVFIHLDVRSIERFGSTCWRARYLTAVSNVWRKVGETVFKVPAMGVEKDAVRKYKGEWRTALVEEERIRMDGCYIAVCHYIRAGAGDQWVTVTHMITYHRYLRFYPDGTVISFLTTDLPSDVVPILRPSLRAKGLHFGRWRLIHSDSSPPARRARIVISDLLEPGADVPKYEFEMELALRETGRGKWNKLDILEYRSVNLESGEVLALSLKHQKPFYFSKVKSYHPQF